MTTPNLSLTSIKLGDSATPSKNFIISVPDIPDGTLTIERGDGTDVLTIDAAGKVVMPGNAQTVTDVASSRALGGTYTNSTAQPIKVYVSVLASVSGVITALSQGQYVWADTVLAGAYATLAFEVPAGANYAVVVATGTMVVNKWVEIR